MLRLQAGEACGSCPNPYATYHGPQKAEMFFDMEADPEGMKNIVGEEGVAAQVESHRKMLADWNKLTELDKYPIQPNAKAERPARRKETKAQN